MGQWYIPETDVGNSPIKNAGPSDKDLIATLRRENSDLRVELDRRARRLAELKITIDGLVLENDRLSVLIDDYERNDTDWA